MARNARGVRTALPFLILPLLLDAIFISEIIGSTGGTLCPTLDDAFIHFEYARSLVEGRPLSYNPGDPATTGATSFLYIALLAVGWALGARGLAATWLAHTLGVACLAIACWAAKQLGTRVAGAPAGWPCALAVLAIPQYAFEALGGMEIALVTATHLVALLAAVDWILRSSRDRSPSRAALVCLAGALAAASRPEGITAAAPIAALLLVLRPDRSWSRALAPLAVLPAALPALVAWSATGQTRTNGQLAKWMFADPYLTFDGAMEGTRRNVARLFEELLAGVHGPFAVSPMFRWLALAGFVALAVTVVRQHRWRGLLIVMAVVSACAAMLLPASYWTFDTNRGRYLWPFVPALAVIAVLGAMLAGRALARSRLRMHRAPVALSAAALALMCARPSDALSRVADSASEICAQHLPMAERVSALPPDAVVAVNDAGALRYLTGHRTYDLVGLTTPDAATAWNAGSGSIFEQLERAPARARPGFMAIHPNWVRLPIGGPVIHAASVPSANHVGGDVMELRALRAELFGSGARPASYPGDFVDALDVADLESERAHDYRFEVGSRGSNTVTVAELDGRTIADGGRILLGAAHFRLAARAGRDTTLVTRIEARGACVLELRWNGAEVASLPIEPSRGWRELSIAVPARLVRADNRVERRCIGDGEIVVHHDWVFQP